MNIPSVSKNEIKAEFDLAIAWMQNIGVVIGSGRIRQYQTALARWLDAQIMSDASARETAFPQVASAAYEVPLLLEVYAAFKNTPAADLRALATKLNRAAAGPFDLANEKNESSTARNFLFEAIVAAKFHRPGLGMVALINPNSDSGFMAGNRTVFVESKRLGSLSKLENRVKDARDQLNRNLAELPQDYNVGIIALDISRLVNPSGMLYSTAREVDMDRETSAIIDNFLEQHREMLYRVLPSVKPRIIAVIIRMSVLARSFDQQKMVINNQWAGLALRGISPRQLAFLQKVFSAVHQMPESALWKSPA